MIKVALILILLAIVFIYLWAKTQDFGETKSLQDKSVDVPEDWPELEGKMIARTLPAIAICLSENPIDSPTQSKFGGDAAWPSEQPYPKDKQGQPLRFIAQINFAEIHEPLEDFPTTGLLQFFIGTDDLYGATFIDSEQDLASYLQSQKDFAVVYHPQIDNSFEVVKQASNDDDYSPMDGESAIVFEPVSDPPAINDYRFEKQIMPPSQLSDELNQYLHDRQSDSASHKLGGYADFTQQDPREFAGNDEEWLLLLQIDSDANRHINIMWGDMGIGNFFIRRQDLQNRDFSKVWYNWDCG